MHKSYLTMDDDLDADITYVADIFDVWIVLLVIDSFVRALCPLITSIMLIALIKPMR